MNYKDLFKKAVSKAVSNLRDSGMNSGKSIKAGAPFFKSKDSAMKAASSAIGFITPASQLRVVKQKGGAVVVDAVKGVTRKFPSEAAAKQYIKNIARSRWMGIKEAGTHVLTKYSK